MKHIKWHMSEEEFNELQRVDRARCCGVDAKRAIAENRRMNDVIVAFEMGKLWVEIEHTFDPDNWQVYPNVYALGIDGGYGETRKGKIPYDLTDIHFSVRAAIESGGFKEFKRTCEMLLPQALEQDCFSKYKPLMYEELGNWD